MKKDLEKGKYILEVFSDIYIALTIILFPLIVDSTGFFHILECKWYTYLIIGGTYLISTILVYLYYLIFKKCNLLQQIKLSWIQKLSILFLIVNTISCFLSPYFNKANLFIGVGRGEGLIMITLYTLSFLFITLFSKFKKKYILYFSISSILLNFIAILQYIGFNPFNMYQNGIGTHNVSFMTTIGNVDFISALYCILLTVSFTAYVFLDNDKKINKILHFLSVIMGSFIIGIIDVDSGKVAFITTLILIIPYIVLNNKRFARFLQIIAGILSAYCINVFINPEYHYDLHSLNFYFQFNYIVVLYLIVITILIILSKILNKQDYNLSNNKKIIKYFYISIITCGLLGIVFLYFYNFQSGMLYEIHELLHGNFDDEFGTYRIFLWKRTLKIFPDYLILGSGPDTFAIRFMAKYTNDIAAIGLLTINDTAANVYLTILINLGVIGLFTYLSFLLLQIKNGLKKMNNYSLILFIPMICFFIQDFFNLWVVIVTPIFWLLMALHYTSLYSENVNKCC